MASGWLESVGVGVFKRSGNSPTWQGGLHALQAQDGLAVHVGGLTALAAEGSGQLVRLGREHALGGMLLGQGEELFMLMAERAGLPVVAKLARNRIDLGKGAYVAKYEIVVPRAMVRE